jgi:hypothetical protein
MNNTKTLIALGMGLLTAPLAMAQDISSLNASLWLTLADQAAPVRDEVREQHRYTGSLRYTSKPELGYRFYEASGKPQIVGFSLTNHGSKRINPKGLVEFGATRSYDFLFSDRAREDIHLAVSDDVNISGRYSHDNMFRELHFFPRLQIPTIQKTADNQQLKVTLPTGESVYFDAWSKEIVSGVLKEQPIDFTANRHKRRNPGVSYHGRHLVITVEQRGEAARRAKVWGKSKFAEVHYPAKYARPCRVSPEYIWDQSPKPGDDDPRLTMLHPTDASLFKTIEAQCGWDLRELRLATLKTNKVAMNGDAQQLLSIR